MDRDLFRQAGEALYGPRWQSEMARNLGVSLRTVQRWAAGTHAIPRSALTKIYVLAYTRAQMLPGVRDAILKEAN